MFFSCFIDFFFPASAEASVIMSVETVCSVWIMISESPASEFKSVHFIKHIASKSQRAGYQICRSSKK